MTDHNCKPGCKDSMHSWGPEKVEAIKEAFRSAEVDPPTAERLALDQYLGHLNKYVNEEIERRALDWIETAKGFDFAQKFLETEKENIALKEKINTLLLICQQSDVVELFYGAAKMAEKYVSSDQAAEWRRRGRDLEIAINEAILK